MQVALAHRSSAVLFAASELDVFSHLSAGPMTADEVARACDAKPGPTRFVLDACVTVGMIEREGDKYKNSPTSEFFLCVERRRSSATASSTPRISIPRGAVSPS